MDKAKHFENKEANEDITSRIIMKFFRHGEKEGGKAINEKTGEIKTNEELLLTEKGKEQAVGRSEENVDLSKNILNHAFGSSKERARQTAGLVMAGKVEGVKKDGTFEELQESIKNGSLAGGVTALENLDYNIDEKSEFGVEAYKHFYAGDYLKWLIEQSDQFAKDKGDEKAETYTKVYSKIAEIVEKYIKLAPGRDELVQKDAEKYAGTLKRYFASHQGIVEPFLAKIIEKTKGIGERELFVSTLNNLGFDYVEGFEVDIETINGGEQQIRISYRKEKDGKTAFEYNEIVPKKLIEDLIFKK